MSTRSTGIGSGHPEPPGESGSECFVMVYGETVGLRLDVLPDVFVFGRDPSCDAVLRGDHVSREHARAEKDGLYRYIEDLDSTNGTYVNDRPIKRHRLGPDDVVQIGENIFKYLAGPNLDEAYYEELYRIAITDGLTGIPNARRLNQFLEREFARSKRHGRDLSLLLLDLDSFSKVNEELGHVAGDLVLREFAQVLARRIRRDELLARHRGGKFVIVLPESNVEGAACYAEILREMVELQEFNVDGNAVELTISLGVSTFDPHMTTPADLIRAAEAKLVQAKQGGRNRVVV